MRQRICADPEGGFPAKWEQDGTWVHGTYRYTAYLYGQDEVPDAHAESIAELRGKYWDEAQGALVIPFTGGRTFTFGPKLLSHATHATMVLTGIEFSYPHEGPPPEICTCGKLSFEHAVEYHETTIGVTDGNRRSGNNGRETT